ncbi:hypothetical protein HCG51_03405 [Tolypothrix sp. PCC 7910]|uniref:hypothetical protein n=1 Tax=Tolypothrix sp. PCC 7910 TaxID=2099387 RepID=UPI00142776F6|nr:hypothetical protein [Tolypothrix sp. PCC 7910]QIR35897.1 hypothetical protein HCG51_03405 [Tolypothrix sp. PCC 7910]
MGKCIFLSNCLLTMIWLTSCSNQYAKADLNKEIKNVSSWSATAYMVGDAWIHDNVPDEYAQTTLKKAQEEILKEKASIEKIPKNDKSGILDKVLQLANKTEKISTAIAQKNRTQVQKSLSELAVESQSLKQLKTIPE